MIEHSHWQAFPVSGPLLAFRIGWTGVDLFFVISGFVITYSALALYRRDAGAFAGKYWLHRVSRIVPLYVLTLAAWIAANGHSFFAQPVSGWSWQLVTHLTFTHSFWIGTHSTIDGVNWTLAVEMQFYLLVALLIPWLDRTPAWRIWLYGIAVSWAWRAAMFVLFGQVDAFTTFMHVTQLPGTLDEFAPGIVLAKLVLDRRPTMKLATLVWPIAAAAFGYFALSIYWRHSVYWDDARMVVFWHTAFGAFLFCVVAAAVRIPQALDHALPRPAGNAVAA